MRVGRFRPEHSPALYDVYRRIVAAIPHCRFVPSAASFAASLAAPMEGTELLVAEDGGAAVGLAALLGVAGAADRPAKTELTALFAADEAADRALADASLNLARARGAEHLTAFPDEHGHCPVLTYNAGWCGLSDGLPRAAWALARAGFVPYHRELHLSRSGGKLAPPIAAPVQGMTLAANPPKGRQQERTLRALLDGEQVGVCVFSTLGHLSGDRSATKWGYIMWLHVDAAYRRRGVARSLLTNALATLAAAGCWLTTGATNWPALTLSLSLGFEIVDTSTCFRKMLGPAHG